MSSKPHVRAAVYLRVSSDDQSVDMQRREIDDYCARVGLTVVRQWSETASTRRRRPEYDAMMAVARKRGFDVLVVWRLDRVGRSLVQLVSMLDELRELDIGFASLKEGMDTNTPTGRALFGMSAVFAEFERDLINERVKAGISAAQARGVHCGRPSSVSIAPDVLRDVLARTGSFRKAAKELRVSAWSVTQAARAQGIGLELTRKGPAPVSAAS